MPHRNRIALEHRERMIRAFEDGQRRLLACSGHPWSQQINCKRNRPFYRYGGHIEFILRFKKYYGMPGGTRSVFTRAFWAKRELHMISREKGDHYYFQTWHTIFFFPLQSFIGKLKAPKVGLRRNAGHFPPIPPYFPFLPNAFRH